MTKVSVGLKSFKSNKGLIEPISAFIVIVVLAVGAVVSSNLVSREKANLQSQAESCPEGLLPCKEDSYGEPCGEGNRGVKVCHKSGCSKDAESAGIAYCSYDVWFSYPVCPC